MTGMTANSRIEVAQHFREYWRLAGMETVTEVRAGIRIMFWPGVS